MRACAQTHNITHARMHMHMHMHGASQYVSHCHSSKYPQRSLGAIALDAPMLLTSAFDGEDLSAASMLSSACAADARRVLPTLQKAQCDCAALSDADFAYAANNLLTYACH